MNEPGQEVIRLVRIDFDSMENREPRYETDMGTFAATRDLTASGRVKRWMSEQKPVQLYVGYDGQVYPQFRLEAKRLL